MLDLLYSFGEWLETTPWANAMSSSPKIFPLVTAIHFFSFFLLVGTIVVMDLRLLGLAGRRQSATRLAEQLFPWTWTGLGLALLSGFLMFSPAAGELFKTTFFLIKLLVILLGVVFAFLVQRNVPKWDQSPALPMAAKLMAFISLALWIGVLLSAVEVAQFACV